MYCTYCGSQNSEGTKFCGNCGKPLVPVETQKAVNPNPPVSPQSFVPPRTIPTTSSQNIKVGPKWASIGAALAVLCFFLPWLKVGALGVGVGVSGWQMATGSYGGIIGALYLARPSIFLILLLGLLGFICLNGKRWGAKVVIGCGIAGVIGMIIFSSQITEISGFWVQVKYGVGYVGEWLGFLILAGVGFYAFRQLSSHNSPVTSSIPQASIRPPFVTQSYAPPPVVNPVPPANPAGSGSVPSNPSPTPSATPAADSTPKKNTWKEIG
jgi:hypothetical protein